MKSVPGEEEERRMEAIETMATTEDQRRLLLDDSLPVAVHTRVRVLVLLPGDREIAEEEWLRAAAANPAFEFLKDPEEDIYSPADGKPFSDEG